MTEIEAGFAVGPQPQEHDFALLARQGVKTIVNNRPDHERGVTLTSGQARELAASHGIEYHYIPVGNNGIELAALEKFRAILATGPHPVLAHCASGQRSAMFWALASAATRPADEVISTAARAGFNLSQMRPVLEQLSRQAA